MAEPTKSISSCPAARSPALLSVRSTAKRLRVKPEPANFSGFAVRYCRGLASAALASPVAGSLIAEIFGPKVCDSHGLPLQIKRIHAEDVLHHDGDRLHEFAAPHRSRLRKGAGRRDRALSPA